MDIVDLLQEAIDIIEQHTRIQTPRLTLISRSLAFDSFAFLNREIASMLLQRMSKSFCNVERQFVWVLGPQMYGYFVRYQQWSAFECAEAREARREGKNIKKVIDVQLQASDISPERKVLLEGLVKSAQTSVECPPRGISDIEAFLKRIYESGELAQWLHLAEDLSIPEYAITFLSHMLECAKLIRSPYL